MAGVMFTTSVLVFLVGLVSEQIAALHYGMSVSQITRNAGINHEHSTNKER